MKKFILPVLLVMFFLPLKAQEISEWRMVNRTGVSDETGLLTSWPEGGPELLWTFEELDKGYSSPSFSDSALFITGLQDTIELLYCLDLDGNLRWKVPMGRAWTASFPESRSTPTVEGNRVYTCSGDGDIACFDAADGTEIWSYRASEMNKGTYGQWGIAESLLLDGDKLYYSPGGPETMTIAIEKETGSLLWRSESLDDSPSYASPILVSYGGKKMLIGTSQRHVFAVDVESGHILWDVPQYLPENFNSHWEVIKCVTPLYKDGRVYVTGGYNIGGMMIEMTEHADSARVVWTDSILDNHHGGVVLLDGYIYGANWLNNANGNWCCIDWETGKKMWEEHWNCKGPLIAAEGMLYIMDEKRGNVGLVRAMPEKFDLVSSFQLTQGNRGPFWAHPVIHQGILYLRHNNALMAYNIRNDRQEQLPDTAGK